MTLVQILLLALCIISLPQAMEVSHIWLIRFKRILTVWILLNKISIGDIYERKNLQEYLKRKMNRRLAGFASVASYVKVIEIDRQNQEITGIVSDKLETLNTATIEDIFDIEHFHDKYEKTAGTVAKEDLDKIINK